MHRYLFSYNALTPTSRTFFGQAQIDMSAPFSPDTVAGVLNKITETAPTNLYPGSVVITSVWKFED